MMGKYKTLAILFTIIGVGGILEFYRILTSDAPDITANRKELMVMAGIFSAAAIFLARRFWTRANDEPKRF